MTDKNACGQRTPAPVPASGQGRARRRGHRKAAERRGIERARVILGYTYPIDRPSPDPRFSADLVQEIADLFEQHGFPPLQEADLKRLRRNLAGFLYRPVTQ